MRPKKSAGSARAEKVLNFEAMKLYSNSKF
jgi:hypothetical protein